MSETATLPAVILDAAAHGIREWQVLADLCEEETRKTRALAEKARRERFIARLAAAHPEAMEGSPAEESDTPGEDDEPGWVAKVFSSLAGLVKPDDRLSSQLEACADADAATAEAIRAFLSAPGEFTTLAPRLRAEEEMLALVSGACRQAAAVRRATKLPEVR
jgi:hypothetical protein